MDGQDWDPVVIKRSGPRRVVKGAGMPVTAAAAEQRRVAAADPKAESAIRRVTHTDDAAARGHEKDTGGNQPTMWLPCEYDS